MANQQEIHDLKRGISRLDKQINLPVSNKVPMKNEGANGDIRIVAPNGKIILEAASIALIGNGGEPSGNIYLDATNEVKLTGDKMTSVFDESIGFEVEKDFNVNCSGRADFFCGDFAVVEGADVALPVLLRGGQGTMGAAKFLKGVMKLIKSIT